MLGFTPSELAYVTAQRIGEPVTQGFARTLDRKARTNPLKPLNLEWCRRQATCGDGGFCMRTIGTRMSAYT